MKRSAYVVYYHESMLLPHKVESGYDIVGPSQGFDIYVGRLIGQRATTQV